MVFKKKFYPIFHSHRRPWKWKCSSSFFCWCQQYQVSTFYYRAFVLSLVPHYQPIPWSGAGAQYLQTKIPTGPLNVSRSASGSPFEVVAVGQRGQPVSVGLEMCGDIRTSMDSAEMDHLQQDVPVLMETISQSIRWNELFISTRSLSNTDHKHPRYL